VQGPRILPECGGKRMTDIAAHLVDHIIPAVPVRQFVLSLPHWLRYRLAYDAKRILRHLGKQGLLNDDHDNVDPHGERRHCLPTATRHRSPSGNC
jgi:hypothetical protein